MVSASDSHPMVPGSSPALAACWICSWYVPSSNPRPCLEIANWLSPTSWGLQIDLFVSKHFSDTQLGSHYSNTCLSLFHCCFVMVFRWNCSSSRATLTGKEKGGRA